MSIISKQTAMDIALAYREVETAEKLLGEITETLSQGGVPDMRDAFGRRTGLQLGVPSGSGHRLFDVPWSLAKPIIEAHIANQKAKIVALTEKAKCSSAGRRCSYGPPSSYCSPTKKPAPRTGGAG